MVFNMLNQNPPRTELQVKKPQPSLGDFPKTKHNMSWNDLGK